MVSSGEGLLQDAINITIIGEDEKVFY